MTILNETLSWDGSDLGVYRECEEWSWVVDGRTYYGVNLPQGTLYYLRKRYHSFPVIIHHLTELFVLPSRGIHLLQLNSVKYVIYHVPYYHDFLWYETPFSQVPSRHRLRTDPFFTHTLRQMIVFQDLLSLSNIRESSLIIRDNQPLLINDSDIKDLSIPRTLFERWFGEQISLESVTRSLVQQATRESDMVRALQILRREVENVIRKSDKNYVWYTNLILDRCTRYILKECEFSPSS